MAKDKVSGQKAKADAPKAKVIEQKPKASATQVKAIEQKPKASAPQVKAIEQKPKANAPKAKANEQKPKAVEPKTGVLKLFQPKDPDAKEKKALAKEKDKKLQKTTAKPVARRGFKGFVARVVKYFRDMISELKKATWPSKKDLVKYTGIVLAFVTVLAVVVGLLDFGFTKLLQLITG